MKNFVIYGDTDSMFINLGSFLTQHLGDKWIKMPEDRKIHYITEKYHLL